VNNSVLIAIACIVVIVAAVIFIAQAL